jgi:hypothetical protein
VQWKNSVEEPSSLHGDMLNLPRPFYLWTSAQPQGSWFSSSIAHNISPIIKLELRQTCLSCIAHEPRHNAHRCKCGGVFATLFIFLCAWVGTSFTINTFRTASKSRYTVANVRILVDKMTLAPVFSIAASTHYHYHNGSQQRSNYSTDR